MKKILPEGAVLIPDTAKKVFDGEIFDVYQWPQKMFDGSTETFEMLRRPDTVQIIGVRDNKLVMVKDEQPNRPSRTHFPGGRVDEEDESWLAAAQREVLEETGMTFKNWKLIFVNQPFTKIEQFVPWFVATEVIDQTQPKPDAGERIELVDLTFDDVRSSVFKGRGYVSYAIPIFAEARSLEDLINKPEFKGQEVDR